jgi:hypothetical protein
MSVRVRMAASGGMIVRSRMAASGRMAVRPRMAARGRKRQDDRKGHPYIYGGTGMIGLTPDLWWDP